MVEIKTAGEVQAMRAAGQVVARILAAVKEQAKPGMRTSELDAIARDVLAGAGAYSPFLNYHPRFAPVPYPGVICTSVNDAALHGIPGKKKLSDGDLLSVDSGAVLDGWAADAAVSFTVGTPKPADTRLIDVTQDALRAGIAAAVAGGRIGDISAAIGAVGRQGGYGICTDFGGHGVGRAMHEDPHIPNEGPPGRGHRLVPGLVIAIEPWFLGGGRDIYRIDRDGWTIRSGDGSRAAHAEHTVAITADGPQVLTRLPSAPPRRLVPEGSTMSSSPESPHLDNHHRNTLRQIFEHPVSHNIEWHAVTSLLEAIGTVAVHHDGKITVAVGSERQIFDPPAGKDIDAQMVVDLRHMLEKAGYAPS